MTIKMTFTWEYQIEVKCWQRKRKTEMSKNSVGVHNIRNVKEGMRKWNLK